jgi:hypothetical protein
MNFLTTVKLLISLLPLIIDAVKAVEAAFPASNLGGTKLGVVRGLLEASYTVSSDMVGSFDQLWPAIEKAIAALVAAYKATGAFK